MFFYEFDFDVWRVMGFAPSGLAQHMPHDREGRADMLWTIFVILLVLWLLGMVSSYTIGGFIHILLIIALVVLVLQLVGGRRVL